MMRWMGSRARNVAHRRCSVDVPRCPRRGDGAAGVALSGATRPCHCDSKVPYSGAQPHCSWGAGGPSAMAVTIENRMYVTVDDCPSCDWYVSKTASIDGCVYGEINMNRNDFIRLRPKTCHV